MRTSVWSSYLFELKPEKMVDVFLEHGLDCSELSHEHGLMILERGKAENVGKKFKNFCDLRGFSFPQGHFDLEANLSETDRKKRIKLLDNLKRWCDLFNAIGIKAGVIHACSFPEGKAVKLKRSEYGRAAEMLDELLCYSKGMSFTICLENLTVNFNNMDELSALIETVENGKKLGICLDTGHLTMTGGSFSEFLRKAGRRLKALHITDCMGADFDHILPFAGGRADWKKLMAELKKLRYNGLFNFEIPRETRCPIEIRHKKLDYIIALADEMEKF